MVLGFDVEILGRGAGRVIEGSVVESVGHLPDRAVLVQFGTGECTHFDALYAVVYARS